MSTATKPMCILFSTCREAWNYSVANGGFIYRNIHDGRFAWCVDVLGSDWRLAYEDEIDAIAPGGPQCCLQVNAGRWCQESYETSTGDAGRRAKQLRAMGYRVHVQAMGLQVTPLGTLRLSLVDIRPGGSHEDMSDLPAVEKVEWPR